VDSRGELDGRGAGGVAVVTLVKTRRRGDGKKASGHYYESEA